MKRVGTTNLFFGTQVVPTDARFLYSFTLANVNRPGPNGEVVVREEIHVGDSVLVMPNAPPQPYVAPRSGVPQGKTVQATIQSTLIEALKQSNRLPIRFYMEIGMYDLGASMLGANRQLRDVLSLKGYDVESREFAGGHSYVNWRGTLADGLISLLGHSR